MTTEFSQMFLGRLCIQEETEQEEEGKREVNTCHETQLGQDRFKATAITGTAGGPAVLGTPG